MKFGTEVVHGEYKSDGLQNKPFYSQDFSKLRPTDRKIQNRLSAYRLPSKIDHVT